MSPAAEASPAVADQGLGSARRPSYQPTQEIRFAAVFYGGVSLAIYINGVVQELLHLVRATAPEAPTEANPQTAWLEESELSGTERVYRRLGQMLGWSRAPDAVIPAEGSPIRTRFIVDILSGSSAGGINGIFLGKALANEQPVDQLKRLWIDEGDIALLVNDKPSYGGLGLSPQKPPLSVLNSRRFYWKLLAALDGMDAQASQGVAANGSGSRLVDELDLWITTTDIRGLLLPIDLFDRVVYEKRHRNVIHLLYGSDYARGSAAGEPSGAENGFVSANNPLMAFAGRATAAFPFAFEPMSLSDIDEVIKLDGFRHHASDGSTSSRWTRYFADYVRARRRPEDAPGDDARYYRNDAFGDGGYLDNKPFSWATQAISRRRADLPVDRRLIYVEPDPGDLSPRPLPKESETGFPDSPVWIPPNAKPDPIQNIFAAAVSLPRSEPIRDDLENLVKRNREVDRIRDIADVVDRTADEFPYLAVEPPPLDEWRQQGLTAVLHSKQNCGLQYVAYHRLKVAGVLDDLADMATTAWGFNADSDEYSAIRCLVQAWFERHFPEEPQRQLGELTQNEFLLRFDVRYRLRRLGFINQRIEEILRFDADAFRLLERFIEADDRQLRAYEPELDAELRKLKSIINSLFIQIRATARSLRSRSHSNPVRRGVPDLTRARLLSVLDGAQSKEESVDRARVMISRGLDEPITAMGDAVSDRFEPVFRSVSEAVDEALDLAAPTLTTPTFVSADELARKPLRHFYSRYESYDQILLPMSYGAVDEADRVEVIRVSPQDATSLIDETSPADGRRKLAGVAVHHFGGFFERAWRKNDLMWGRLDAAERLIDTLLMPERAPTAADRDAMRATRDQLLKAAQLAIIEEELETATSGPLTELMTRSLLASGSLEQDGTSIDKLVEAESEDEIRSALYSSVDAEKVWSHLGSDYEVRRDLNRERFLNTVGRATQVTGRLLDGISNTYPLVKRPARWLVRFGQLLWGLVETATPRTFGQLLFRYWLPLLVFISTLLIFGGALFGAPATAKAGWVLLLIVVGWRLAVWITEDVIHRRIRWAVTVVVLALVVVAALAVTESVLHLSDDLADLLAKLPNPVEKAIRAIWPWDHPEN